MKVAVAFSPRPGVALEWAVEVSSTASARDAIEASGLRGQFPELDLEATTIGIWGRSCAADAALKEGDRVELYRPLAMDPNEARRLRAKQLRQRKRT